MEYTTLGRTGLKVSVAGLGAGGFSDLGLSTGKSEADAVRLVRLALDEGINIIDTAASYGTEGVVGTAVSQVRREDVIISTKAYAHAGDGPLSPDAVVASLRASLQRLRTDYVDILHVHGVPSEFYDHALQNIYPALAREKERGTIRHIGITASHADAEHVMLQRAVNDGVWEVVMLAFHMMHQSARDKLFPQTLANGIGTMLMYVVRTAFSRPDRRLEIVRELAQTGQLPAAFADGADPFAFLVHPGGSRDLTEAAYRFARHEPGVDVVLFGTGNREHLRDNVRSITMPPLPKQDSDKVVELFCHLVGIGLDRPGRRIGKAGAS